MKISSKYTASPYGSIDRWVAEKDVLIINKNSAAAGITPPVFAAGATKGILVDELKLVLNTPLTKATQLTTADIKTGFSAPVTIVAAPGVGYFLMPISIGFKYNYVSAAFNGATKYVDLITDTGSVKHFRSDSPILGLTSNVFQQGHYTAGDIPELIENKALKIQCTSDHTTGDGNLYVYLVYQIIRI